MTKTPNIGVQADGDRLAVHQNVGHGILSGAPDRRYSDHFFLTFRLKIRYS